jgi:hypothetical protein
VAHPGEVRVDSRTGRLLIDFAKPLYAIAGSPVCPSEGELDAYRQRKPNACKRVRTDRMVADMEMKGFLDPVFRVRFIGIGDDVVEGWVPLEGLRN